MTDGQKLALKPEEKHGLTKEAVLALLQEDTNALTEKAVKLDKQTIKTIEDFEKKYDLVLGYNGPLDRMTFLNGQRFSIHFVFRSALSEKKKNEFLSDCEELAKLNIGVSFQPDGSIVLFNLNFIPPLSEEIKQTLAEFLNEAKKYAENLEIERALDIHLAFVSFLDSLKAKSDAEKSGEVAANYDLISGADVKTMEIFKVNGTFSKEKFEKLIGISYEDYLKNGLRYAAQLRFASSATKYNIAATYYLDVMASIINGEPKDEYEKKYMFAKETELNAAKFYAAGAFILRGCRMIREGPRAELENLAELIVASGLAFDASYRYIDAKEKTERKIAAGELKIGDKKVTNIDEIMLQTELGRKIVKPAVEELVKDLQTLESYYKLLIIYTLAGDSNNVRKTLNAIEKTQKTYATKFDVALKAYQNAMAIEATVKRAHEMIIEQRNNVEAYQTFISDNAHNILIDRLDELEAIAEKIGKVKSIEEVEKVYKEIADGVEEVAKALYASLVFEGLIDQTKRKLRNAKEAIDSSLLTKDEKDLCGLLLEIINNKSGGDIYKTVDSLKNVYNPFKILKQNVSFADLREGKKRAEELFNMEEGSTASELIKISAVVNALYVLTWKARKQPAEGVEAVKMLEDHVIPLIENEDERKKLVERARELSNFLTPEMYDEFVDRLLAALKTEEFHKRMKDKKWYKKIGPYVGYIMDKYEMEITVASIAITIAASILTAQPEGVAATIAERELIRQAVKRVSGVALKNLLSPKQLAKTALKKEFFKKTLSDAIEISTYPFLIGGTITGVDALVKYFSTDGTQKDETLDQLRMSAVWVSGALGGQTLLLKGPLLKRLPAWTGKAAFAGTHSMLFTSVGISAVERFRSEKIDWLGLGGDVAMLTIGGLSAVRTLKGFKTVDATDIGNKRIPKWKSVLVLGGVAGEIGIFVGGTMIYLKDYVPTEKREEEAVIAALEKIPYIEDVEKVGKNIAEIAKEKALDDLTTAYVKSIEAQAQKISDEEREKLSKESDERAIVSLLFPDIFARYYFRGELSDEKRKNAIAEINKKIEKPPNYDPFPYLKERITTYFYKPEEVKQDDPLVYKLLEKLDKDKREMLKILL
jgi:hypothetical protein